MPRVCFTSNLQRHVDCPELVVPGDSVRRVLENVFTRIPKLRGYLLDDQGSLHRHMAIMVNGEAIQDRSHLEHPVSPNDEIYVLQSLSGG